MLGVKTSSAVGQRFASSLLARNASGIQARCASMTNRPSFAGQKRKRSDNALPDNLPRKKSRTNSLEIDVKIDPTMEVPSSFIQPLPPFEPSAKITPLQDFKITDDHFKAPAPKNNRLLLNKDLTSSKPSSDKSTHPSAALCKANTKIGSLTKRIRSLEEQTEYWRRKSLTYSQENTVIREQIDKMKQTVRTVEGERVALQTSIMRAEANSNSCINEIRKLMSANAKLMGTVGNLNEELKLADTPVHSTPVSVKRKDVTPDHAARVETALTDTLSDLTEKINEIDQLKKALAEASSEKSRLDEVVTRNTILTEMLEMENDDQKDAEGCPKRAKIAALQSAVVKCVDRITQLSDKNEAFKAVIREARDAQRPPSSSKSESIIQSLDQGQKVQILESLCMQRYRLLLREAAESLVGTEVDNGRIDESF